MGSFCSTNATTWAQSTAASSSITAASFNEIVTAITREITRRGTNCTANTTVTSGSTITAAQWQALATVVNSWTGTNYPSGFNVQFGSSGANTISASLTDSSPTTGLKNRINAGEVDCPCNCNYCTCDCNYCTCNCNYYCTCNCDHSCTCNCNNTSFGHNP